MVSVYNLIRSDRSLFRVRVIILSLQYKHERAKRCFSLLYINPQCPACRMCAAPAACIVWLCSTAAVCRPGPATALVKQLKLSCIYLTSELCNSGPLLHYSTALGLQHFLLVFTTLFHLFHILHARLSSIFVPLSIVPSFI